MAQTFGSAAGELCFAPALTGRRRRTRPHAMLPRFGGAAQHVDQPVIGVLAIALLCAEPPRRNDQLALRVHPPPGNQAQSRAHPVVEARRAGGIKAELDRRGDLIDVLTTGPPARRKVSSISRSSIEMRSVTGIIGSPASALDADQGFECGNLA